MFSDASQDVTDDTAQAEPSTSKIRRRSCSDLPYLSVQVKVLCPYVNVIWHPAWRV